MANSTSNLDLIQAAQAQKEVTANDLHNAASPSALYARRGALSTGLTWAFYGGVIRVSGGGFVNVNNGSISLTNNATNYVQANLTTGAVSANTTAFGTGFLPLYTVVTSSGVQTSWTDHRQSLLTALGNSFSFLDLTDTPTSYASHNNQIVVVNPVGNGLTFKDEINTFLELSDTPSSYIGQNNRLVAVNALGNALHFVDPPSSSSFLGLSDTPNSYNTNGLKTVRVNAAENGLEFVFEKGNLGSTFDGGGAVLTVGANTDIICPFDCEIVEVILLADQTGSVTIDVLKSNFTNYPTFTSITASAKPAISGGQKARDTTLAGWSKNVAASDVLRFNVDSVATIQKVSIHLIVNKK